MKSARSTLTTLSLIMLCITLASSHALYAQRAGTPDALLSNSARTTSLDRDLLLSVYSQESSFARGYYHGIDASSWPMFIGGPVLAWVGSWTIGGGTDWDEAYRLTVSGLFTTLTIQIIKKSVTRYRPYVVFDDITSRSKHHGNVPQEVDQESFPSGHSAQAWAIATSLSLSYPRWYVIAPAVVWASSISLSRLWLGVHFPTDVLVGALVGAGMAVLVHVLDPYITPNSLLEREIPPAPSVPLVRFKIPLYR